MRFLSKFGFRFSFIVVLTCILCLISIFFVYPVMLKNYIINSKVDLLADMTAAVDCSLSEESQERLKGLYAKNMHIMITDENLKVIFDNASDRSQVGSYLIFGDVSDMEKTNFHFCTYTQGKAFTYCFWYELTDDEPGTVFVQFTDADTFLLYRHYCWVGTFVTIGFALLISAYCGIQLIFYTKRRNELKDTVNKLAQGSKFNLSESDKKDDITAILRTLNHFIVRQRQTEELRQRFVSDASHELKTPLASVKLLSESVLYTPNISAEDTREFLTDINMEIDRLTRICTKLLTLSKLDIQNQSDKVNITDMKKVVENVARILHQRADESDLVIRTELQDDCLVYADYDLMYQVVFNLVENAIKYGKDGKEIRVLLYAKNTQITLIVDDDGYGIPESELPLIFDRFYRVDTARARATGGSGLGLSIVKTAVTSCNGTVCAKNRQPHGARFEVTLPLAQMQAEFTEEAAYEKK